MIARQVDAWLGHKRGELCRNNSPCMFELFIRGPAAEGGQTHIANGVLLEYLCENAIRVVAIENAELGEALDIGCSLMKAGVTYYFNSHPLIARTK